MTSRARVLMSRGIRGVLLAAVVTAAATSSGCLTTAEWAADFYIGPNFPTDEDVDVNAAGLGFSGDADFDGGFTVGARGGRWFNCIPELDVGAFLDVSGVFEEVQDEDFTFLPITFLPMARLNLMKTDEFPGGRLQPHVGVGPSIIWSEVDGGGIDDDAVDIGLDARAGASFGIIDRLFAILEYRATVFEPDYKDSVGGASVRISAESVTHHLLFGAGIRF